eukprot:CAMPEP_0203832210 /NCGR_PEP_ID=MMETSP0115-20131106/70213_1 /ASSEMBLY_ACC=CAM_ASM_000227 /TAXON_ID=33651 /ORGANISM="Bicosoecid sp, Strain ms1" /LENGTH=103 /DNA_ID=CAMNT_0050741273 /DNA_START=22 /DNA_END=330 /DNA_ORIENTATION=-
MGCGSSAPADDAATQPTVASPADVTVSVAPPVGAAKVDAGTVDAGDSGDRAGAEAGAGGAADDSDDDGYGQPTATEEAAAVRIQSAARARAAKKRVEEARAAR